MTLSNALTLRNPYAENRPATPGTFYGRAADVRWMIEHLAKPYPDSLAIAGPRRIGKTSLLHYVRHIFHHPEAIDEKVTPYAEAYRELLAPGQRHLHVYIDASRLLYADDQAVAPRFWRALLRALQRACRERAHDLVESALEQAGSPEAMIEALEEALHTLARDDVRVIFYLDEVEQESFPFEVGQVLRSLAMQWGVAFVIASQRSLLEWLDDPDDHNSPFYNMLAYRYLRPMPDDEAYRLLTDPARRLSSPDWLADHETLLAEIVRATGGHPALVKLAGERLWELTMVRQQHALTLEEVLNHVRLQGEPIFMSMWNALNEQEHRIVQALAHGKPAAPTPETERLYDLLRRDGILVETEHGWQLFSPLFADYVRTLLPPEQPSAFVLEGMHVYVPHQRDPILLTRTEHRLLAYLLEHRGETCTREALLAHVWGKHEDNKVLDVTIQRLRRKIEPNPREPQYLLTVRGQGYRFESGTNNGGV